MIQEVQSLEIQRIEHTILPFRYCQDVLKSKVTRINVLKSRTSHVCPMSDSVGTLVGNELGGRVEGLVEARIGALVGFRVGFRVALSDLRPR